MTGQWTHSVKADAARRAYRKTGVAALSAIAIMIASSAQALPQPDVAFPRPEASLTAIDRQAVVKQFKTDGHRQTEAVNTGLQVAASLLMLAALFKVLRQHATPVLVANRARRRRSK
jgi:hypothetical protein